MKNVSLIILTALLFGSTSLVLARKLFSIDSRSVDHPHEFKYGGSGNRHPQADRERNYHNSFSSLSLETPPCELGSFFQAPAFAVGSGPQGLVSADFDGDARADIAAALSEPRIAIRTNSGGNGNEQFRSPLYLDVPGSGLALAAADLDGDGLPDLIHFRFGGGGLSVFRNASTMAGQLVFSERLSFVARSNAREVSIVDINSDGKPDILVSYGSIVSVYMNTSSGVGVISFGPSIDLDAGPLASSVNAGDLDADGKPDLVISNTDSFRLSVFRNISTATVSFAPRMDLMVNLRGGASVEIADLDGDGRRDVIYGWLGVNSISTLRNTSTGAGSIAFAPGTTHYAGYFVNDLKLDDFDGDGKKDVAVSSRSGRVSVFRNESSSGSIALSLRRDFGVLTEPRQMATADFDADGDVDLTVANSGDGTVSLLKNVGSGEGGIKFESRLIVSAAISDGNWQDVALADIDRDGRIDVLTGNSFGTTFSVLRNTGSLDAQPSFAPAVSFGSQNNGSGLALALLDADDRTDVITSNRTANSIVVSRNQSLSPGNVSFSAPINFGVGLSPVFVTTADLNGDRKPDVLAVNQDSNEVSVLQNQSTGNISFAPPLSLPVNNSPFGAVVDDLDGDGRKDVVVANNGHSTISIFRNSTISSQIQFAPRLDLSANSNPFSVITADFDGDQRIDIAVSNRVDDRKLISIFRNNGLGPGMLSFEEKLDIEIINDSLAAIWSLSPGDLNDDGKIDIVATYSNSGSRIVVLKNSSSSANIRFEAPVTTQATVVASSILVGDVNGDSSQDIITASYNSNVVEIFAGSCRSVNFSITGQVRSPSGLPLRNIQVSVIDSLGNTRSATTSSFGLYSFSDILSDRNYTIRVLSKRYRFTPKVLRISQNLSDVDFLALE